MPAIILVEAHFDPISNNIIRKNLPALKGQYQCQAVAWEADENSPLDKEIKRWKESVSLNEVMKKNAKEQGIKPEFRAEYESYAINFDSDEAHLNLLEAIKENKLIYQGIDKDLGEARENNLDNFDRAKSDPEREAIMAKHFIAMYKKHGFFIGVIGLGHTENVQRLIKKELGDEKAKDFKFVCMISRAPTPSDMRLTLMRSIKENEFIAENLFPLGIKFVDVRKADKPESLMHLEEFIKPINSSTLNAREIYLDVKKTLGEDKKYAKLMENIQNGQYGVALRNACHNNLVSVVECILKYEDILKFINEPSSNGNTALDWLIENQTSSEQKDKIITKMRQLGAHTAKELEISKKLEIEIQDSIGNNQNFLPLLEHIKMRNYGIALRNACNCNALDIVKIMLRYKDSLPIDLNGQSKNGNTALDWLKLNKDKSAEKSEVIALMKDAGASHKTELKKEEVRNPETKTQPF